MFSFRKALTSSNGIFLWHRMQQLCAAKHSTLFFQYGSVRKPMIVAKNMTSDSGMGNPNNPDKKVRPKSVPVVKVTLLKPDGGMMVLTFEEAKKISEKRNLKLVKITDENANTKRAVYKLMTEAQYLEEELKEKQKIKAAKTASGSYLKGDKVIVISASINDNDFKSKMSAVKNWLRRKFEVRISISATPDATALLEKLFQRIENETKGKGKILQKRVKNGDMKFQILPPKHDVPDEEGNSQLSEDEKIDELEFNNEFTVDFSNSENSNVPESGNNAEKGPIEHKS